MKKRILCLLAAIIMATQCACAVPAELQGISEEEIIRALKTIAASGAQDKGEDTAADAANYAEEAELKTQLQEVAEETELTVDEIIAAYNSTCVEVSAPAKESDVYHPVSIVQCACYDGDCYMVYPQLQDAPGAENINNTIRAKVLEQAAALAMPVFSCYKVEYNRNGIFSLRMLLYDLYGEFEECLSCVPMTFNVETGELYSLNDFFNSEDQSWRGLIPDIITVQAENSNMVLLSDILPVSDDQPFYISEDGVVITYDLYEIATYSAGEPEFEISVGELAEYIAPDGILNVFLTPTPAVEVTLEPEQTPIPEESTETPLPEETQLPEESESTPTPVAEETLEVTQTPESEGEEAVEPLNDGDEDEQEVAE